MSRKIFSKRVYVPCAVSSFFEICDRQSNGSRISDELKIGARGGGFIISKGSNTVAYRSGENTTDSVLINNRKAKNARTSLKVIELLRRNYPIPPIRLSHKIEPPIGSGFGTSGSGAIGSAVAISDLFDLHLTLCQISDYAHRAEIQSITGLGTVISLVSGAGAIGLVTEPGSFSRGRVDSLLDDHRRYVLICASFGPIEKSTVILDEEKRGRINLVGRETMKLVMKERTAESLLTNSRLFAERTGLASNKLLGLANYAKKLGAIGATQNMIGNAIHCLVLKSSEKKFLSAFRKSVPHDCIFWSDLAASGPKLL